jgi:hypothetical protein
MLSQLVIIGDNMHITAPVTFVEPKVIKFKSGPRAGKEGYAWSITADGKKIDMGFNKPLVGVGDMFSGEITDAPDRWGTFKIVKPGSTPVTNGSVERTPLAGESYVAPKPAYKERSNVFPIPKSDHATSICRQSALKAAVDFHYHVANQAGDPMPDPTVVLETAALFANWTTGQAEAEEAARILKAGMHEVAG